MGITQIFMFYFLSTLMGRIPQAKIKAKSYKYIELIKSLITLKRWKKSRAIFNKEFSNE